MENAGLLILFYWLHIDRNSVSALGMVEGQLLNIFAKQHFRLGCAWY